MIQKIKGTMDILPDETPLFRKIEAIVREEAEHYGKLNRCIYLCFYSVNISFYLFCNDSGHNRIS